MKIFSKEILPTLTKSLFTLPLKRKRLFKTFANSKDFFMTKNSWVIFNQFKVLLLLDGFVASIKIEYDVFTTKTGLLTLLSLSWIILRLQWGCYQPNFLLIIKILFQFYDMFDTDYRSNILTRYKIKNCDLSLPNPCLNNEPHAQLLL